MEWMQTWLNWKKGNHHASGYLDIAALPDYNNFGDVLVFWCMAGLASLIILLTLKIGRRKNTKSLPEETLQQIQAQG